MPGNKKPWLWIACAFVAAACLAGSMFSHRWLVPDYEAPDDGFSPRSMQLCIYKSATPTCQVGSLDSVVAAIDASAGGSPKTSPLFVPAGTLCYYAAFIAFAALLISGFLAMSKPSEFPVSPTSISTLAIVVGGIAGVLFVTMRPGQSPIAGGPFQTGWGAVIFGLGTLIGLIASRKLAPMLKPVKTKVVAVEATKAGRSQKTAQTRAKHNTGSSKKKRNR